MNNNYSYLTIVEFKNRLRERGAYLKGKKDYIERYEYENKLVTFLHFSIYMYNN